MGLSQNIKKIFEELDAEDLRILGLMAGESRPVMSAAVGCVGEFGKVESDKRSRAGRREIIPYDVWKQAKKTDEPIPQRTVYGKIKKLVETKYIVKTREQEFKEKLVKQFYKLTVKGLLAALAAEKVSLDGSLVEWLRAELHIPKRYEKAVKPIIFIWAYCESRVSKLERRGVDAESILQSILESQVAWKDMGPASRSILSKKVELPPVAEFREQLGITDEEYRILNMFISTMLTFRLPAKVELGKRTLAYGTGVAPTPWLADCVEILPDFAIRVFWAPSEFTKLAETSNYLSWFLIHKRIAGLVSQGDQDGLRRYLMEVTSKLQVSCLQMCFKREYDGICKDRKIECPYGSPLECETVRENAKRFEDFLDSTIKSWSRFKS
jgi:hypothetical protein